MRKIIYIFAFPVFLTGLLMVKNYKESSEAGGNFQALCDSSARVSVINSLLWKRYIELAKKNSVRTDKKPTLVELEGFTLSFGDARSKIRQSFPVGIFDDKVFITHPQGAAAILFDKVKINESVDGFTSDTCLRQGLEKFISNEVI